MGSTTRSSDPPPVSNFSLDGIEEVVVSDSELVNDHDSGFSETLASQFPIYLRRSQNRLYRDSDSKIIRRTVRRLIKKSGRINVIREHIPDLYMAYFRDLANTLVDSQWRWTVIILTSSYMLSWLIFAWLWMLIQKSDDDSDSNDQDSSLCLVGVNGFAGYFLFSLETQHTIGYGTRFITDNCPEGTFLLCLQVILGCAICGGVSSIVYTKMVRPHKVHSEELFSRKAVVCQRDRKLCLIFRVRDEENKHSVRTIINAYLVQSRSSKPFLKSLTLEQPGLLLWPLEVVHPITPSSPFWNISAKDFITKRFEIILTMQGTSGITGQSSLTRTSYLTTEILWGHRFKPCVAFDHEKDMYCVNHTRFNETEEVLTPLCSAQRLQEVVQELISPISSPIFRTRKLSGLRSARSSEETRSWGDSSGIGSLRESVTSSGNDNPPTVCRKLSVIREWKSVEDIKTNSPNTNLENERNTSVDNIDLPVVHEANGSDEQTQSLEGLDWESRGMDYLDDIEQNYADTEMSQESTLHGGSFKNKIDVEGLITSLQNLLDKQNMETGGAKAFCETNF